MYFEKMGPTNTDKVIEIATDAARERGIGHIVLASNTGDTALRFVGCGLEVVCVSHAYGYREKGQNEMPDDVRARLTEAGVRVLSATHVLSGVERGISTFYKGLYPAEIMAYTLRMFGQGVKVCVEIAIMALDAGLIPYGKRIVAVGGSERGADTAVVMTPAHAAEVFRSRIHRILCKPE